MFFPFCNLLNFSSLWSHLKNRLYYFLVLFNKKNIKIISINYKFVFKFLIFLIYINYFYKISFIISKSKIESI